MIMMNVVNIMLSFSSIKKETQETFNDSVKELVRIVNAHNDWVGKVFVYFNDKDGQIEENEIVNVFYDYNEETHWDALDVWYVEELMKELGLSKVEL